ncbi:MAG: hypothetical protein [Circular genetic element sp.]|nr:MAG: hypothetical protein [Circular genetic element sp.]
MKIQKMVSLDENTAKIAAEINNFSKWVRDGLHAQSMGTDLASEYALRLRWVGVARHLAATLAEYANEIDAPMEGLFTSADELIAQAMEQTRLEDFV